MSRNKPYSLKKLGDKILVIGLSNERIDQFFGQITKELSSKEFSGTIIFDLLLSNGNNSRRFFQAHFKNNSIDLSSVKKLVKVDDIINDYSINYFLNHKELLHRSILTSNEIERIVELEKPEEILS